MKVFKEVAGYEAKPMFGMTWRQLAAAVVMAVFGGGFFALITVLLLSMGVDMREATSVAMWALWPVLLPAALWGWWRPKGLMPEKFLSFAARDVVMKKEVVYGTACERSRSESVAGRGSRAEEKAQRRQLKALRRSVSEHL